MLRFENVTFVRSAVKSKSREEFIASHIDVFWKDRPAETRRKMLSTVYSMITKVRK